MEELGSGVSLALACVADDGEGKLGDRCSRGEGETVGGIGGGLDVCTVKGVIGRVEDTIIISIGYEAVVRGYLRVNDMSDTVEKQNISEQNLRSINPSTSILGNSKCQISALEARNSNVRQIRRE